MGVNTKGYNGLLRVITNLQVITVFQVIMIVNIKTITNMTCYNIVMTSYNL